MTLASPRAEPPLVRIWDDSGKLHFSFLASPYIHGLRFSPDGRLLAVACVRQTLVIDVRQKKVSTPSAEQTSRVCASAQMAAIWQSGTGRVAGGWCRVPRLGPGDGARAGDLHRAWSWWAARGLGVRSWGDALVVLTPTGGS